ncbi:DUF262 domain-containing protein [Pseudomonas faucium]|uniref:DUF262 domain-containing protein n=1 Tax=Pseudomonas faucium TaxID=2740518 RepID=UPI0039C20265
MSENGIQITLQQLLSRHQRIQIPMIQRDYAQGRQAAEEVRKEFLGTLKQAFGLTPNDPALPLNLDFIYGSVDVEGRTKFLPLDGQQRLTTLFLLHWYLAWRDGGEAQFRQVFCEGNRSRFNYSVRPSSSEFFDELVNYWPQREAADDVTLDQLIKNQAWYFRYWRLDPTIQSCLAMLKAIHEHFSDVQGGYHRLTDEQQPVITFQLLDLEHFGLSDDLYIKMNARGKPLTAFETFKARYEHELKGQYDDETREISGQAFPVADYFARRMDTLWADFFWAYRDKQTHLFDDAIMNFFHAIAFICRDPVSTGYLEDVTTFRNKPLKSHYALYHNGKWLERVFSDTLMLLLETWSKEGNRFTPLLGKNPYFDEDATFQRLVSDPATLAYTDLVQLYAYVAFLCASEGQPEPQALLAWMRVIYNLSVNSSYERPADMQRSLLAVQSLLPHAGEILQHFANNEKPTAGFYQQQVNEEQIKAELLLAHEGWRELIEQAEVHGYFKGQIEFLLAFSGVLTKRQAASLDAWKADDHRLLQRSFAEYLQKAEFMFNDRGLNSLADFRWERALLSLGDYLLYSGSNYSFLVNSASEQASWKRLLRGGGGFNEKEARALLHQLLEPLDLSTPVETQLDELIASAQGLEPWRQVMVHTPEVFHYCGEHALRWDDKDVYLLKKSRMSGMHAELFSYHLALQLKLDQAKKALLPLEYIEYQSVSGSEFEPQVIMTLPFKRHTLYYSIFSEHGYFKIRMQKNALKSLPELQDVLVNTLRFEAQKESFQLRVARDGIHKMLSTMARATKALDAKMTEAT